MKGHGEAVEFMKGFNVPMLVTGGGGYTKHNVARCWAHETAILVGKRLPNELPPNDYREYYAPDYCLDIAAHRVMDDCNRPAVSASLWGRWAREMLGGGGWRWGVRSEWGQKLFWRASEGGVLRVEWGMGPRVSRCSSPSPKTAHTHHSSSPPPS